MIITFIKLLFYILKVISKTIMLFITLYFIIIKEILLLAKNLIKNISMKEGGRNGKRVIKINKNYKRK